MLLRNGTLLQQYPLSQFGGGVAADRVMFGRHERRSMFGVLSKLSSIPNGYRPPVAWVPPQKPGGMSSRYQAEIDVAGSATINAGRSVEGIANITVFGSGAPGLIVSIAGNNTFSIIASGAVVAVIQLAGNGSLVIGGGGQLGGVATMGGIVQFALTAALQSYAVARLSGAYTPFTELSPEGLARAVWQAGASIYNDAGSMGEKLNAAGAAGDPLTGEIEDGETLRQTMRLIRAILLGNGAGLEGTPMEFRSRDGSKVRVRATYDAGSRTITLTDAT